MNHLYSKFKNSAGVSIDTRILKAGELFFCLKGANFNGNKFADQAIEKGASFVIMDDPQYFTDSSEMILVDDSLKTLQDLASYHRHQFTIPIIGITGTNGKTTTKELISAVLSQKYQVLYTQGNLNNHIGVPLTLLRLRDHHDLAVIEMGANHVGEIEELCQMVQPNYGVLTNVGHAHLEGFGSFENVLLTKKALYSAVDRQKGTLFVNADDEILMEESKDMIRTTYGTMPGSDLKVQLVGHSLKLNLEWEDTLMVTHLFGRYNLSNVAAAISVGHQFKVDDRSIKKALEEYKPTNNRSQIIVGAHNEIIMDAYNANPDSMKAAIGFFNEVAYEQKALILGDMLELGDFEEREHRKILAYLSGMSFTRVILVGPAFYRLREDFPEYLFFRNGEPCLTYLMAHRFVDYKILLKGSRGIQLELLKDILLS